MKQFLVAFSFVFISLSAFSQLKGPVITFDKTLHDYGTLYQNDNGDCVFTFKNDGDEPLVLSSVKSSCGCTVPKWPRDPILPGQSNSIQVTYDTKRLGMISKQITVVSNATVSTVVLTIKGNVLQKPAEVMPEKQLNQGFSPTAN
jgi:hypothetical protein